MMKLALALTLAAAACHSALGQTPIPARPDGWKIGSPGAPIVLESFFDLMVRHSALQIPQNLEAHSDTLQFCAVP